MNLNLNKVNLSILLSITAILISSIAIIRSSGSKKYAYVRSGELINGYIGVKEAKNVYQSKTQSWSANVDSLKLGFQKALTQFNMESPKMSAANRKEQENNLRIQQQNLMEYERAMQEKAREEDEKITSGILNQINSYVEDYGKKNGYDIIFGTSTTGNLLYGTTDMDITEEVLKGLNESYTNSDADKN